VCYEGSGVSGDPGLDKDFVVAGYMDSVVAEDTGSDVAVDTGLDMDSVVAGDMDSAAAGDNAVDTGSDISVVAVEKQPGVAAVDEVGSVVAWNTGCDAVVAVEEKHNAAVVAGNTGCNAAVAAEEHIEAEEVGSVAAGDIDAVAVSDKHIEFAAEIAYSVVEASEMYMYLYSLRLRLRLRDWRVMHPTLHSSLEFVPRYRLAKLSIVHRKAWMAYSRGVSGFWLVRTTHRFLSNARLQTVTRV
jgi:hypothetical protein